MAEVLFWKDKKVMCCHEHVSINVSRVSDLLMDRQSGKLPEEPCSLVTVSSTN